MRLATHEALGAAHLRGLLRDRSWMFVDVRRGAARSAPSSSKRLRMTTTTT
ncbi:hypothetical protein WMF45_28915 [Sorangium sp. So ce448]|uniref:hypothetical protein n=1 Tax=Sorangium sp. So ce448 TaxID=3133314 RepID=UPI003F62FE66